VSLIDRYGQTTLWLASLPAVSFVGVLVASIVLVPLDLLPRVAFAGLLAATYGPLLLLALHRAWDTSPSGTRDFLPENAVFPSTRAAVYYGAWPLVGFAGVVGYIVYLHAQLLAQAVGRATPRGILPGFADPSLAAAPTDLAVFGPMLVPMGLVFPWALLVLAWYFTR
jgi:hypothetical protein